MKLKIMKKIDVEKPSSFGKAISIACALTNLSQLPSIVNLSITKVFSVPVWIIVAVVCAIKRKKLDIYETKSFWILLYFFFGYIIARSIFNHTYLDSKLNYQIFMAGFIVLVGSMAGEFINKYDFDLMCETYIISGMIVCVNIFTTYLMRANLRTAYYAYGSKNSVSQILLTVLILILYKKLSIMQRPKRIFYMGCFIFTIITLIGLKSRAAFVGLALVAIWGVFHGRLSPKAKKVIIFCCVIGAILMLNENIRNYFIEYILYAGRKSTSINALTSGRSDEWKMFFSDWKDNWLFGMGATKRESLVLTALLVFGVIGGVPVLLMAVYPLIWGLKKLKGNEEYLTFTSIAIVYWVYGNKTDTGLRSGKESEGGGLSIFDGGLWKKGFDRTRTGKPTR